MRRYLHYYHGARTHLALQKDAPEHRSVQPPERGKVIEIPEVGGLHHPVREAGSVVPGIRCYDLTIFASWRRCYTSIPIIPRLSC
jgi:hypothetical protein